MDQVSRPVLIALAAAVLFVVAHFTVLAPKSGSGSSPASATAPGQAGLQSAIDKANNAVGVSKQSATRSEQAAAAASGDASASAGATAPAQPATANKAKATAAPKAKPVAPLPKLEPGDHSGPILRDLAAGKVVVALFFNPHGADDNAALRAVRTADRHHGRVVVHSIPIQDVGNYNALTTGVKVLEAPTIMVIAPNHKARTIVGYTEVKEVDQMVGDMGGRAFQSRPARHLTGWAAKASNICKDTGFGVETSGTPTDISGVQHMFARAIRLEHRDRGRVAQVPASGARQVAAKRALIHAYDTDIAALARAQAQIKSGASPSTIVDGLVQSESSMIKQYRPALRAVGEHHCLG